MAELPGLFDCIVKESDFAKVKRQMEWHVDRSTGNVIAREKAGSAKYVRHKTLLQCAVALGIIREDGE